MVWCLWCFEYSEEKDDSIKQCISESVTEVYVEQPCLHQVC